MSNGRRIFNFVRRRNGFWSFGVFLVWVVVWVCDDDLGSWRYWDNNDLDLRPMMGIIGV